MTDSQLTELNRMIAVMEASKTQPIEIRLHGYDDWSLYESGGGCHAWNWAQFDYRVKPAEPLLVTYVRYIKDGQIEWRGTSLKIESGATTVSFIELTPEIRAKLNL